MKVSFDPNLVKRQKKKVWLKKEKKCKWLGNA